MPTKLNGASVTAVARAMAILDAFRANETSVTLSELARRTTLHKTTVLRIARTMAAARYLVQLTDGSWRLGPKAGWIGARYQTTFDGSTRIESILRNLSNATGESAIYYIREEDSRICVVRVDGPNTKHRHVRVGEAVPLPHGAVGRVLLAFSGEPGMPYDAIRRSGYHMTLGERDPLVGSIACPVFGLNSVLLGCIALSGPVKRFTRASSARYLRALRKAATELTYQLGRMLSDMDRPREREKPRKTRGDLRNVPTAPGAV